MSKMRAVFAILVFSASMLVFLSSVQKSQLSLSQTRASFASARLHAPVFQRSCRKGLASHAEMKRKDFMGATAATALSALAAGQVKAEQEAPFTGTTPISMLTPPQKDAQRTELYILMKSKIGEKVAEPATTIMQLALLDAVDRDTETKTGGFDGGIQFDLDKAGASSLSKAVGEIKAARDAINAEWKSEDKVSFVDTLIFAAYLKTKQSFNAALSQRSTNGGGATIATGFGNPFDIPPLGRPDAESSSGKSVSFTTTGLYDALKSMGFAARDITALAIGFPGSEDIEAVESTLAEMDPKIKGYVKGAQQSRKTVTQNAYQVNVGEAFNKLVQYRQPKVNSLSYYYPAPKLDFKKLKL